MSILQTSNLKKTYGSGDAAVHALDGISFFVDKGEFVAIVGTSGSGKSTLLHMLGGLDRPTSGDVTVDGQKLFSLKDDELTVFRRRKIGFVFQNYNLVPSLNVYENIVLPIQLDGNTPDADYINSIVETLGLGSKLKNLASNLSGGQQQRVAIARALSTKPAIILADEPTGNLDPETASNIIALLRHITQMGTAVVMTTHNIPLLNEYPGIVYRCIDGHLEEITNDYNKIAVYEDENMEEEIRKVDYSTREDL